MKAILKVAKGSAYEQLNGHTFEVKEFNDRSVDLKAIYPDTPGITACFSFTEILIVDLDTEYRVRESLRDDELVGNYPKELAKREIGYLQRYCIDNGFEFNLIQI